MASARRTRPIRGNGTGGRARRMYAEFLRDLLAGTITATQLHDQVQVAGTERAVVPVFVEDPNGTIELQREDGTTVRGRFDSALVDVPRRRIVQFEYTDPNGAARPGNDRIDR